MKRSPAKERRSITGRTGIPETGRNFGTGVLREENRQRNNPTVFFQARDP